jgi:hypothetical protein
MKALLLFLFIPILTAAQTNYHGTITNKSTKQIIPFVSVGLMKENIGTNADESGSFQLVSNNIKKNDTLIISCIGFQTLKIPADNKSIETYTIELIELETVLKEVVVTGKKYVNISTLNEFSNCGTNFFGTSGIVTQLAQHFTAPSNNSILKEIKICRFSIPLIAPDKTIFRIRVYEMDTITKAPTTDLTDQIIEVKTRSKYIQLNLEKFNIYIPNKDFFVAIEWLKIPYNEERTKSKMSNGKTIELLTYRPSIGWTDNINPTMEAWMLDYKNLWRKTSSGFTHKTSISIEATVKY